MSNSFITSFISSLVSATISKTKFFLAFQGKTCPRGFPLSWFFQILIFIIFSSLWKSTTALKDTGKALPQSKSSPLQQVSDDAAKKWVIKQTLANSSSRPKAHSWPQIRCTHDKCSSSSRPFFITWHSRVWSGLEDLQMCFDSGRCRQPFQRSWTIDLERLLKLQAVFKKIINASLWNDHSGFRLTPAENSWALPLKKWKNKTKHSKWVPWAPLWLGDHWKV